MPDKVLSRVDLPEPLAPTIATISPGFTDKEISHKAWRLP